MTIRRTILTTLLLFACLARADEPPQAGNLLLRVSQQPGSLVGFGGNIIDKNESQVFLIADDYMGVNRHAIDAGIQYIYGFSDSLSFNLSVPYAVSYKSNQQTSHGIEDIFAQLETAIYAGSTSRYTEQLTLVGNVTFNTGSVFKNPSTGNGAPAFFVGTTYSRIYVDWLFFGGFGALLTTANDGTKSGNDYLYQFGFGRNITDVNGWILTWMTEIDDTYTQRSRMNGVMNPNSGGNIVFVTPSIWASTNHFIFQFGVGVPVAQNWNGNQTRNTLLVIGDIGWSF